jgi:hypothetical protein
MQAWFYMSPRRTTTTTRLPVLGGLSTHFLDDKQDLVSLKAALHTDMLSRFLRRYWPVAVSIFLQFSSVQTQLMVNQSVKSGSSSSHFGYFDERRINFAVAIISTLVAAILLVGSISTLYFVTSPGKQLGLLAGFTAGFALSVALLTNAQRAEIFAATAA